MIVGSLHGSLWDKGLWCLGRTVWIIVNVNSRLPLLFVFFKMVSPETILQLYGKMPQTKLAGRRWVWAVKINQITICVYWPFSPCSVLLTLTTAPVVTSASDKQSPSGRLARPHYDHKRSKSGRVVQLQAAFKQSRCVVFGDRLRNSVITPVAAARSGARPQRPSLNEPVLPH